MSFRIGGAWALIVCAYACYWSLRLAVADYIIQDLSPSTARIALRLAPGSPDYYLRLAQADPAAALSALRRAAEFNPRSSSVWMDLAAAAEQHDDLPQAESSLKRAVATDKTFAPRWLLAQFYFRRKDQARFWPSVRAALDASYDDVSPLFDMCWSLTQDPAAIPALALPDRSTVSRQYLEYLLARNRLDLAAVVAIRTARQAASGDLPTLLIYCDRVLEKGGVSPAVAIWNLLAAKHLLHYPEVTPARGPSLINGSFSREFLAGGFDWRVSTPVEISFRQDLSAPGVWFNFFGRQPQHCELMNQYVPLEAGRRYRVVVNYETDGMEGDTGIGWRAMDVGTGADLLHGSGRIMASQSHSTAGTYQFETPGDTHLVKLILAYDRPLGAVRAEGSLALQNASLGWDR